MTDKTEVPKCKWCGKPLRRRTYLWAGPAGKIPTELGGKKVVSHSTPKTYLLEPDRVAVNLWTGERGDYGDGFFCGLRCGYAWAVNALKRVQA